MARLALFDLDNTLLDRDVAFALWTEQFVERHRLSADASSVIERADGDGLNARDTFFLQLKKMFGIETSVEDLLARYYVEYPACYSVDEGVIDAVRTLRADGWKVGVVTNGPPSQQAKLEATNMMDEFDALCISQIVGAHKPDILIFEEAARRCGLPLDGWMVGDSASADIGGGKRAGLQTIWMSRGRAWDSSDPPPDATALTIPEAVATILSW
jgi:HAD superfamily hydrolase (TIGR01549 family)